MHVHTIRSKCSLNNINLLKKICLKNDIVPVIADHNLATKTDFGITGEEIATDRGEFIGLFLNEEINEKDIFEAIDKVKEQGGLVYLPHPFDVRRRRSLCKFNILDDREFIKKVDVVEVFNSRCITNEPNIKAFEYARKHDFLIGVGSDAHFIWEIGNAYINFEPFDMDNPKEFLKLLSKYKKDMEILSKNLEENPWISPNYYAKKGCSLNILLFSKVIKKIRRKLDI
ncbi:PHP domain protein [Methanotorris formicicus Mc-S-70]|uniref:PHP domain protein n=2 Tax=Methanotorris formicicus TaxID=213185 RepID=H1KYS1_9EURY|nr:PHP domain protein [Methanotorris formicicus Mc-S-70]